MFKWLHHLFNPHCPECKQEHKCGTCETLRELLEAEKFEKKQLLDSVLGLQKSSTPIEPASISPEEVKSKYMPWKVRQQMLEAEDRERAKILSSKKFEVTFPSNKEIESLEKELDIKQEVGNDH